MLMIYGKCRQNAFQAAYLYAACFPNRRHFEKRMFTLLANKLRTTGNISTYSRHQKQNVVDKNDNIPTNVLAAVAANLHISTRTRSQ